jgi:hypothetical protein
VRAHRCLGWFAVAVIVGHHLGTLLTPLGDAGRGTEWADWVDLLTPYAVVGTALAALLAARVDRATWLLAALGTVVYTQGHGIHLAANSVGNARGNAQPVHLWDEVVGHYLWYGGLFLLVAALVRGLRAVELASPWRWPVAVLFGLTAATNAIEGGTAVFSTLVAAGFCVWARRIRLPVLMAAYATAALLIAGWGIYWAVADGRFFPQFSELGWI